MNSNAVLKMNTVFTPTPVAAILAAFVTHIEEGSDERSYTYTDPQTQRDFDVSPLETFDDADKPCTHFLLVEMYPTGYVLTRNSKGQVLASEPDARILAAGQRVGPNGLMGEIAKLGIDTDNLSMSGGGACRGAIYHPSLEVCAEAIFGALLENVRYQHRRELTPQEQVKFERLDAQQSHAFWESEASAARLATEVGSGLFKGCHTGMGNPLPEDSRKEILAYLNKPSLKGWNAIRSIIITGRGTLWQAWCAADASASRTDGKSFPAPETLRTAIREAVDARQQEIEQRRKSTSPTGLKVVK